MSLRRLTIAWCILMCTLAPAKAHQVQIGVEQGLDLDSNVLGTVILPQTDGVYRLTPTISLAQPESKFSYMLRYRPTFSGYFKTDGINGWDHILTGRGDYQFSRRDVLRANANFVSVRGIRSNSFVDAAGQTQVLATQPGITRTFDTDLEFEHGFSAHTAGTIGVSYNRWDYTIPDRVGNQGYGASGQLTHGLDERLTLGLSLVTRYRAFGQTDFSPASYSTVVNANLLARLQLTDRLSLDLSGGPAGVFTRQSEPRPRVVSRWSPVLFDPFGCPLGPCGRVWGGVPAPTVTSNCGTSLGVPVLSQCGLSDGPVTTVPGFPGELVAVPVDPNEAVFGRSDESMTYFVSAELVQRFKTGSLSLSFVRNEDGGSGIGATTISNYASAGFVYALSDYWEFSATGSYFLRESVSRFPRTTVSARPSNQTFIDGTGTSRTLAEAGFVIASLAQQEFEQEVGSVDLSLLRRLSDHSRLRFRFRYYNQSQNFSGGVSENSFDRFVGGIFYIYEFDPYKF